MSGDSQPVPNADAVSNPFRDVPIAASPPIKPCSFFAKTWMEYAKLLVFGGLGGVGLVIGPLFWLEILREQDGTVNPGKGFIVTATSPFFLGVAAWAWLDLLARRKPLIQLFQEGLALRLKARQVPPQLPVRVTSGVLSHFLDLHSREAFLPWEHVCGVTGSLFGPLTIVCQGPAKGDQPGLTLVLNIHYRQEDLDSSVNHIAEIIKAHLLDTNARRALPSLRDSA